MIYIYDNGQDDEGHCIHILESDIEPWRDVEKALDLYGEVSAHREDNIGSVTLVLREVVEGHPNRTVERFLADALALKFRWRDKFLVECPLSVLEVVLPLCVRDADDEKYISTILAGRRAEASK